MGSYNCYTSIKNLSQMKNSFQRPFFNTLSETEFQFNSKPHNGKDSGWESLKQNVQRQTQKFVGIVFTMYCDYFKDRSAELNVIIEYQSRFKDFALSQTITNSIMKNFSLNLLPEKPKRRAGDPKMQKALAQWILKKYIDGEPLDHRTIKLQAIKLSQNQFFKASKGWLQKFYRRFPQLKRIGQIGRKTRMEVRKMIQKQPQFLFMQNQPSFDQIMLFDQHSSSRLLEQSQ